MSAASQVLVIGVGNTDCGDDAVGPQVARLVNLAAPPGVTVVQECRDGAEMIDRWTGTAAVIAIDAAVNDRESVGAIQRFDAAASPLPAKQFHHSTHAFGLAQAIELSRALNMLPRQFIVYGVVGRQFGPGTDLSAAVGAVVEPIAFHILAELASIAREAQQGTSTTELHKRHSMRILR